jgi:hypothetical protein
MMWLNILLLVIKTISHATLWVLVWFAFIKRGDTAEDVFDEIFLFNEETNIPNIISALTDVFIFALADTVLV